MELGNAVFGHSRGTVEIPRYEGYEEHLLRLFKACEKSGDGYGVEFVSDTFEIHRYWWGDDEVPEATRPNFTFKPTGYELRWYKYILRDSYASKYLSLDEFGLMIDACIESLTAVTP